MIEKKKCGHLLKSKVDFKINTLQIVHLSMKTLRQNIMQLNITKKVFPGDCGTIISNARKSTLISPIGELLKYLETAREI